MDKGDFGFALFCMAIVVSIVIYNFIKRDRKKTDDAMLAALPSEERDKILAERAEKQRQATEAAQKMKEHSQKARKEAIAQQQFGAINSAMMCPHCQIKGKIRTKKITKKTGVSGSKAAAAVVTGGLSVLAVGLARKEASTQAHCDNCGNDWFF